MQQDFVLFVCERRKNEETHVNLTVACVFARIFGNWHYRGANPAQRLNRCSS